MYEFIIDCDEAKKYLFAPKHFGLSHDYKLSVGDCIEVRNKYVNNNGMFTPKVNGLKGWTTEQTFLYVSRIIVGENKVKVFLSYHLNN